MKAEHPDKKAILIIKGTLGKRDSCSTLNS